MKDFRRGLLATLPLALGVIAFGLLYGVMARRGELEFDLRTWATLVGAAVVWRTRNVLLTILGGMATFWLLRAFGM